MDSLLDVIVRLEERIEIDQNMLKTPEYLNTSYSSSFDEFEGSDFDKFVVQCDNDLRVAINCIRYCADHLSLTDIKKLIC